MSTHFLMRILRSVLFQHVYCFKYVSFISCFTKYTCIVNCIINRSFILRTEIYTIHSIKACVMHAMQLSDLRDARVHPAHICAHNVHTPTHTCTHNRVNTLVCAGVNTLLCSHLHTPLLTMIDAGLTESLCLLNIYFGFISFAWPRIGSV